MADADLIVRGRILTMEPDRPTAKAMAVGGGRILAVGTEAQADRWRGRRTKVWTLRAGQTVVPGFIDAHAHLGLDAWRRTWVDLGGSASLEEALERLRARLGSARQGEWIVARGWDESAWPVKRYLTRHDLDRVSVSHAILANRVDGHLCSVNSAALRRINFGGEDAGVERGPDRAPTGVLKEDSAEAAREAIPRPPDAEWARFLEAAIADANALGITSVHDCVEPQEIRAYQALHRQNRLRVRAYLLPYDPQLDALAASGLRTGFGDPWLRLGAIKAFADGSLGARTAALFDPYDDDPRATGELVHSPKELAALIGRAHGAGFQVAVHAIGDRAIDVVVEAYERVLDREPREDHRHRIEHCGLPTEDALARIEELGVTASMQPNFVARWSHPGGLYERRLGRERVAGIHPFATIGKRGIPLAFGSDGMPYGPLFGIAGAVRAPFEAQTLTPLDALRAYTIGAARAGFAEADVGSLAVGKLADFVVLSGNPLRPPADLAVDATAVGGDVVSRR